ncbi:actin depolymerizing protein, partial [Yamadazyma tenuis ATCC 10573]
MSTQSGITASPDLLDAFQSSQHDVLVVKVSEDSTKLVQDVNCPQITGELPQVFPQLNQYISSIHPHPVYILLALEDEEYAFISFIPDIAHIRDKMLYASTKNTLLQELGGGKIKRDHLFAWSELSELSFEHFDSSRPTHALNNEDVLTSEEKYTKEINALQDLTLSSGRKLASMDNASTQLLFRIDSDLENAFASLATSDLIVFSVVLSSEHFKLISKRANIELGSLVSTLEASNDSSNPAPQFAVYSYSPGKSVLIYTCPSGSKVKDRMIYASNKQGLINHLKSLFKDHGLELDKVLDIGDPEELEIGELKPSEEVPSSTSKSGLRFNKPKGPRR